MNPMSVPAISSTSQIELTPLHAARREVYYDQTIDAHSPHYNIGGYIVLKGEVDKEKVRQAIKSTSEVFDALRLRFDFSGDEPYAKFTDVPNDFHLAEMDFSRMQHPAAKAVEWMQSQFNTAFDYLESSLFEMFLLKISEQEHGWYLRLHHLIERGWVWVYPDPAICGSEILCTGERAAGVSGQFFSPI